MLEKFLLELGLSEKEAKIYMALLEVDTDSVSDLAKKTGINRTTVYPVIESLQEKKLVRETKVKGKTQYMAESPDRLETYVEQQKLRLNELENRVHDMIPRFKGVMRDSGERPIIEYYEGRDAILNAAKESLASQKQGNVTYMIYPRDLIDGFFTKKELAPLREIRIKKGTKTKTIYTYSKGEYNPDDTGNRFRINGEEYPVQAEINVSDDKINIYTLGDVRSSIFIQSKDAAETLRTLFRLAFKGLEKDK